LGKREYSTAIIGGGSYFWNEKISDSVLLMEIIEKCNNVCGTPDTENRLV
jgi:hypothetical protein